MKMNPARLFPCVLFAALLLFAPPIARAQTAAPATSPALPAPSPVNVPLVVLPFVLEGSSIVLSLPMTQAGQGSQFHVPKETLPFRLVLDTGADFSILADEAFTARKIVLPSKSLAKDKVKVQGSGNESTASAQFLMGVEFGAETLALHLTPAITPLGMLYELGIDGLLGAEIFQSYVVEVDYKQKIVRFFDPKTYVPPTKGGGFVSEPLRFVKNDYRPIVPVDVTPFGFPQTTAYLTIDTGAAVTVTFAAPFVRKNKWQAFAPQTVGSMSVGIGGLSNERRGRLKQMQIGGVTLATPYADFSFNTQGILAGTSSDGLLGGEILRRFTVIFDYSRATMYLRPTADALAPFPYHYFGWHFGPKRSRTGGWPIQLVDDKSPAAHAGIKVGEVVFTIDKQPVAQMSRDGLYDLLSGGKDGERVLSVGDANGTKRRDVRVLPTTL